MEPTTFSKNRYHLYNRIKMSPALQLTQILTKVCLLVMVVFTLISVYVLLSPKVRVSQNEVNSIKDHTRQYVNTATINRIEQGKVIKDIDKESERNGQRQRKKTLEKIENEEKIAEQETKMEINKDTEKENEKKEETDGILKKTGDKRARKTEAGRNKDEQRIDVLRNKPNQQYIEENENGIETKKKMESKMTDNDEDNHVGKENERNVSKTTEIQQNNQIRVLKEKSNDVQEKQSLKLPEIRQQSKHPATGYDVTLKDQQQEFSVKVKVDVKSDDLATESEELISVAKRMSKNNTRTVLVAAINDGYTRLVYNWLCNTKDMGIHNQVLFVVFDEKFAKKLQNDWPEVTSIYYKGINDKGNMYYGTAGYARIVLLRVQIIMKLLQNDIKILLFETDFVWFRNPLPFLENITDYDLAVTKASLKDKHEMYCIGFVFMYPTVATKSLWKNLSIEMQQVYEKVKSWDTKKSTKYEHGVEQNRFSHLLFYKYADIKYKVLPELKFPDGQWYLTMATKSKAYDPILIHNNFVLGNGIKEFKAKMFGHWFIKDDLTCNNKKPELSLSKSKKSSA